MPRKRSTNEQIAFALRQAENGATVDEVWDSLASRHVDAVATANGDTAAAEPRRDTKQTGRFKKVCVTDPDASMATSARNRRLEPSYKQHAVVDDDRGVVLDVEVTTGETNEGQVILERLCVRWSRFISPPWLVSAR